RPERVPAFEHAVSRPLAGNDLAVELARQPDREIADVDHLLHFALALFEDLAGLDRHEAPERGLVLAQFRGVEPYQLAAPRRRHRPPQQEGLLGGGNHAVEIVTTMAAQRRD